MKNNMEIVHATVIATFQDSYPYLWKSVYVILVWLYNYDVLWSKKYNEKSPVK